MDADDLDLFERSLRAATEQHTATALDDALDQLGWRDAVADDPRAAISILFGLLGAATATSSAIDHVVRTALLDPDDGSGDPAAPAAVVLPAFGSWAPPAALTDGALQVHGLATAALGSHPSALVVATSNGGPVRCLVPTAALELRPVTGVDPELGLAEVRAADLAAPAPVALDPDRWAAAVRLGQIAVAHELIGVSRTMLALAREHALDRVQFGQPIATFQAVRHRLAEALVAIEIAGASVEAAWLDPSPAAASMAKALAGRGARTVSRHCQQVCAGIGFTTEHPLHRSIRRALTLDGLFGTAVALTRATGDDLIASRQLPPLLPL